jgi:hypothetical protein
MDELILDTSATPVVVITRVGGDLRLTGWDQNQIQLESNDEHTLSLNTEAQTGNIVLMAEADCAVRVPRQATLRIQHIGGDAKLKNLEGNTEVNFVSGDLVLRQVGAVNANKVGGDLNAKKVGGSFTFQAGGDVSIRSVVGDVAGTAGADLYLRDIEGHVQATAGSDVVLSLEFGADKVYEIKAGSDALCRLSPQTSAKFTIRSGSEISVDVLGARIEGNSRNKVVTLGSGAAQVTLNAGSDVTLATVTSDPDRMGDFGDSFGSDFGVMAEEFAAQIESQIEIQMSQIEKQIDERLNRMEFHGSGISSEDIAAKVRAEVERAAELARRKSADIRTRIEDKVEAAERKAERAAEKAERHTGQADKRRKTGSFVFKFDNLHPPTPPRPPFPPRPPTPPRAPQPPLPPVSDEERMAVLKMLEQGKISVAQAEKLLAALEGTEK